MKFAALIVLALYCNLRAAPIRVLVWDEQQPAQQKVYTNFLGNAIAAHLQKNNAVTVRSANLNQPNAGLSDEVLDATDVLIWWGHVRQDDVRPMRWPRRLSSA